jgi:hypothetical protein
MTAIEEMLAMRHRVVAKAARASVTPEGKAATAEVFAQERASIRAQIDEAEAAVQAARDALTQGPTDVASKALAETMFARVWPKVQADLAATRAEDGGTGVALAAIEAADDVLRPLLTQKVVEAFRANGLSERTIDAHVLMPSSPELQTAFEAQGKVSAHALIALHNLDQIEQGTDNLVAQANN